MTLDKFTVKDIIFIAILSAALTLSGLITMPLVMSITLFGVRNMTSAILYSLFSIIGLMKVRKMGTLTLLGLLHGAVLLMMTPVMFFTMFIGAFVSELIVFGLYRDYKSDKSIKLAATLFIPMTLPATLIFTMAIHGETIAEIVKRPALSFLICIGTIVLSYLGTILGYKLGKELQKTGKL